MRVLVNSIYWSLSAKIPLHGNLVLRVRPGKKQNQFLVLILLLVFVNISTVFGLTNPGRDSITLNTSFAPKISSLLSGEVKYNSEYSSVIKIETSDRIETRIKALSKPEWLKLSSDPQVRIKAESETAGSANGGRNEARFFAPYALALDSKGTVYVADQVDNLIRRISPTGEVSTVAGTQTSGFINGTGKGSSMVIVLMNYCLSLYLPVKQLIDLRSGTIRST